MKRAVMTAAICGCLLIGSLYPKMLLDHHMKLIDGNGRTVKTERQIDPEIPVTVKFRFLEILGRATNAEQKRGTHRSI